MNKKSRNKSSLTIPSSIPHLSYLQGSGILLFMTNSIYIPSSLTCSVTVASLLVHLHPFLLSPTHSAHCSQDGFFKVHDCVLFLQKLPINFSLLLHYDPNPYWGPNSWSLFPFQLPLTPHFPLLSTPPDVLPPAEGPWHVLFPLLRTQFYSSTPYSAMDWIVAPEEICGSPSPQYLGV